MIQPTSNYFGYGRTDATGHAAAKPAAANPSSVETGERLTRTSTDALREALDKSPEIRPEVVERTVHLAVDPNYPPREIIQRLAKMIIEANDPAEQS